MKIQIEISTELHEAMKAYQSALKAFGSSLKPLANIAAELAEGSLSTLKEKTRLLNCKLEQIAKIKTQK